MSARRQVTDRRVVERLFAPESQAARGVRSVADRSWSATCIRTVAEVAGALTPVPGGVGPLTIAMLLKNTLAAAQLRAGVAG